MPKFLPGNPSAVIFMLILTVTTLTQASAAFPADRDEATTSQLTVRVQQGWRDKILEYIGE